MARSVHLYLEESIRQRIEAGVSWLRRIHTTVLRIHEEQQMTDMELCTRVVRELGLPPLAANPLVARSHITIEINTCEGEPCIVPKDLPRPGSDVGGRTERQAG
ncbi:MAG: hypothetical protein ACYC9M_00115 [Desulfobulbaceae bacterium]